MTAILLRGGQAMGVLGVLLMAIAVVTRLSGRYIVGGFETGTLLLGGVAAIGVGCFALLSLLVERGKN
jgi:hypothetical protein